MFFEWISENALSLALLALVILIIGFLIYRMILNSRRAASSPNPGCYGCPNAKRCGSGCHSSATSCDGCTSCSHKAEGEKADK